MMGHGERHNERLLGIIAQLVSEGVPRDRAVEAVGMWQIGEARLPELKEELCQNPPTP